MQWPPRQEVRRQFFFLNRLCSHRLLWQVTASQVEAMQRLLPAHPWPRIVCVNHSWLVCRMWLMECGKPAMQISMRSMIGRLQLLGCIALRQRSLISDEPALAFRRGVYAGSCSSSNTYDNQAEQKATHIQGTKAVRGRELLNLKLQLSCQTEMHQPVCKLHIKRVNISLT